MFQKRIIFFVLLFCSLNSFAQQVKKTHSPKKASLYSAILPGAGQFYNKKYWKIPLAYLGIGASLYSASNNQKEYLHYRKAFEYRTDNDDTTIDPYVDRYSEANLITIKDYYRKNRDLSYIVAAGIYILNIIDASVDAHLYNFNVSNDLTLKFTPTILTTQDTRVPVLSLKINL